MAHPCSKCRTRCLEHIWHYRAKMLRHDVIPLINIMKKIHKFNHRDILNRELFLLSVDNISEVLPLPEKENDNFALLLLMDGRDKLVGDLGIIPQQLIEYGLVYLCTWGNDCERIHDIFTIQIEIENEKEIPIMTTWHDDESIDETLWFFLFNTFPDDKYFDTCKTAIVISVGNSEWEEQLRNGMSDIDALDNRVEV